METSITSKYALELLDAATRTERFKLNIPNNFKIDVSKLFLHEKELAEFPYVVRDALPDLNAEQVVNHCFSIHHRLQPIIAKWLGCNVIYTLGWIDDEAAGIFKFDDNFITEKLRFGHAESKVNMHAWLTLPSMEIIDVSLGSTIAFHKNEPKGHGRVMAGLADGLKGFAYKPMLIGDAFLIKTGMLFKI